LLIVHHICVLDVLVRTTLDKELLMQLEDLVSIAMENTSSMEGLSQKTIIHEPYTNIGTKN